MNPYSLDNPAAQSSRLCVVASVKEYLRLVGIKWQAVWITWLMRSFIPYVILSLIITIFGVIQMNPRLISSSSVNYTKKAIFMNTNFFVVFCTFVVYSFQTAVFTLLMGQFFSKRESDTLNLFSISLLPRSLARILLLFQHSWPRSSPSSSGSSQLSISTTRCLPVASNTCFAFFPTSDSSSRFKSYFNTREAVSVSLRLHGSFLHLGLEILLFSRQTIEHAQTLQQLVQQRSSEFGRSFGFPDLLDAPLLPAHLVH